MTRHDSALWRRLGLLLAPLLALTGGAALAVEPFNADYTADYMGMQGTARMALSPEGSNRWKYSLEINGAGARLTQNTVFEAAGNDWRPVSSSDSQRGESGLAAMLVKKQTVDATYDWNRNVATWSGDIDPERTGPVQLRRGDVDGMLLNLVLVRDFAAGKSPLEYRLVDEGRARRQVFKPSGTETITVEGKQRQATKLVRTDGKRQITAWVVDGLPVPARILQQRDGRNHIDLRLKSLR